MPVLQTSLTPTESPGRVDLTRRRQESETLNRPETKVAQQQFMNRPVTGDYLQQGLDKIRRGKKAPELRPGDRFQMPGSPERQTGWSQPFEQQLQSIVRQGQQATEAVRAREAYQRQQQLQQLMQHQDPQYGNLVYQRGSGQVGPIPNYTGDFKTQDLVAKSAPLGMLGAVAPHAEQAAREVSGLFGISNIGGHATSGHIPGSDHYTGRAIDVMLGNRGGYPVVNYMMKNAPRLGVKYIIYNRRYWEPGSGWEPYTGDNPHTGHVHVSFR